MSQLLIPLLLSSCLPAFPSYEALPSWQDHDFDGDLLTEKQGDCNDEDSSVHPGVAEVCDGLDNDCNGVVDDDAADELSWYDDLDGDTYGDPSAVTSACDAPEGTVSDSSDCDDSDVLIGPPTTYYGDLDGDTFGGILSVADCEDLTQGGLVTNADDCDDANANINPETIWNADTDGDAYGNPFSRVTGCAPGEGWVLDDQDCDDESAEVGAACAWRDLSMADYFGCGVRGNGQAVCWGDLYDGALEPPDDLAFLDVDVADRPNSYENYRVACGIREEDAGITCWGVEGDMIDDAPEGAFAALSVGMQHACALTLDGEIVCWGADGVGQVSGAPSESGFTDVIVGENLSVALDVDGEIRLWGNGANFPGPSASGDTSLPTVCQEDRYAAECDLALVEEQLGGESYVQLGVDPTRVCGLTVSGQVRCAGAAEDLDRGADDALEVITVTSLAVGRYRTCGLEIGTGAIVCGGTSNSVAPDLTYGSGYTQFSASLVGVTDCALWADASAVQYEIQCWGANDRGEGEPPN